MLSLIITNNFGSSSNFKKRHKFILSTLFYFIKDYLIRLRVKLYRVYEPDSLFVEIKSADQGFEVTKRQVYDASILSRGKSNFLC